MIYWIEQENNLEVMMSEQIWQKMAKLCVGAYPNECGGILIGEYSEDLKHAKIKKIMVSKNSAGSRMNFLREAKETNYFLRKLWHLASGAKYFIGEWHSHPNGYGAPSFLDDEAMYKIARSKKCSCRRPILFILHGGPKIWRADSCWIYLAERIRLELKKLK